MSPAKNPRKRQTQSVQAVPERSPVLQSEMADDNHSPDVPPKRPRRSTAASQSNKRKKKEAADDNISNASSVEDQVEKKKQKVPPKKLTIPQMNQAFQDAVQEGNMLEAFQLLASGKITSASKRDASVGLMRLERVDDLKRLIEEMEPKFAKVLLNTQLKEALADKTDLPVIKTILSVTSWKNNSEWRDLIFTSDWTALWMFLLDSFPSDIFCHRIPASVVKLLNFDDWGLMIDKGLQFHRYDGPAFWKHFINTPNERPSIKLLQSKGLFEPEARWLLEALACDDIGIVRFLKDMGVQMSFIGLEAALEEEKVEFVEAMIECGADVMCMRRLVYLFSERHRRKPASVKYLVSKGLKLSRTEKRLLFESRCLDGVRLALDQGGDPMDFDMSAWRTAIRGNWIEHLQLYVDHGIHFKSDKGFAIFCVCYNDNVNLLKKLLEWGCRPFPEALEYAEFAEKSSELIDTLRKSLDDELNRGIDDSESQRTMHCHALGLQRTGSYLKKEVDDFIPSSLTSSNTLETFVHIPAFFSMLQMLDITSVQKVRQACRLFRALIPPQFFMEEERVWMNLASGVEMDYAKVIIYKHQMGAIKDLNRMAKFPWRGKDASMERLYNIAVLLEDKRLLSYILKNMASTDFKIVDSCLLMLLAMSSLLSLAEVKSLLSGFSVSDSESKTVQDSPCRMDAYLSAYEAGPLEALKYISPFLDKAEALMIDAAAYFGNSDFINYTKELNLRGTKTLMNIAASIAAERGNEEMVNALISFPWKQGKTGAIISEKVVLSGNWSIVLTMLRNRFEFRQHVLNTFQSF
ncbi:hypothetical protein HDU67_000122 [Dinochytrium kinnereticum]|nr:hypothetical protein HDU67_000122 [Dinochytrium kinnereticum]